MKKVTSTISFRATPEILQQIDRQRSPFGLSRGEWVRGVIHQQLERVGQSREGGLMEVACDDIEAITAEVAKIDTNVTRSLFILLTLLGNIPAEQVKEIIRNKMSA